MNLDQELSAARTFWRPARWDTLTQPQQVKVIELMNRIIEGEFSAVKTFIVEKGGRSMPEWLKTELLVACDVRT